jgi:hypothetical protein
LVEKIFTAQDAWLNGFYKLIIDLEERSDERCRAALEALKTYPPLDAWYLDRDKEPYEQPRVSAEGEVRNHRYGVLTLPNGKKVPCGCFIFRTDYYEPDWLEFYIPQASLDAIYPTGAFPFGPSQGYTDWEREVDAAFFEVARHLYQHVRFPDGLIGFEPLVDDMDHLFWAAIAGIQPEDSCNGYLWAGENGLEWHPPRQAPRY